MTIIKIFFTACILILYISCGIFDAKPKAEPESTVSTTPIVKKQQISLTESTITQEKTSKQYYDNGQLKSEGVYRNGKKEGLHKEWTKDGVLSLEGEYKKGLANGLMKWYHGEGHLAAKGSMVNNQRHGFWTICGITPNEPCIHANFTYELRTGIWKIFHDNGQLAREQTWKADKMQYEECWDEDGKKTKCVGY